MRYLALAPVLFVISACACCPSTCRTPAYTPPAYVPPPYDAPEVDPLHSAEPADPSAQQEPEVAKRLEPPKLGPHYDVSLRLVRTPARGSKRTLGSPRLSVKPGQQASLTIGEATPYVGDYDAAFTDAKVVINPIVHAVHEGLQIELVAVPDKSADDATWIGYHISLADLKGPIRTQPVVMNKASKPVRVQLPKVSSSEAVGARRVRGVQPVLLAQLRSPRDGAPIDVFATIRPTGDVRSVDVDLTQEPDPSKTFLPKSQLGTPDMVNGTASLRTLLQRATDKSPTDARQRVRVRFLRIRGQTPTGSVFQGEAMRRLTRTARRIGGLTIHDAGLTGASSRQLTSRAFVQDYDVKTRSGKPATQTPESENAKGPQSVIYEGAYAYDPLIGTIKEGQVAQIIEHEGAAGVRISWAKMPPMETFSTRLEAGARSIRIELPELRVASRVFPLKPGTHLYWLVHSGSSHWIGVLLTQGEVATRSGDGDN